jgi:hypothetical protein
MPRKERAQEPSNEINWKAENNGGQPHFLLLADESCPTGHHIFGPYSQSFAEHMQETFGGTVLKEDITLKNNDD